MWLKNWIKIDCVKVAGTIAQETNTNSNEMTEIELNLVKKFYNQNHHC